MRLWSLHPALLDRAGLGALWREGLLAQAVLAGRTRGYRNHPQLERFRTAGDPRGAIVAYLHEVRREACRRGYAYDAARIDEVAPDLAPLAVTSGQVAYELEHLRAKLARRSPADAARLPAAEPPVHPLFVVVSGPVEAWERPDPVH